MAALDLHLPALTTEDFNRAWTRFELIATVKDWNAAKWLFIVLHSWGKVNWLLYWVWWRYESQPHCTKASTTGKGWTNKRYTGGIQELQLTRPAVKREDRQVRKWVEMLIYASLSGWKCGLNCTAAEVFDWVATTNCTSNAIEKETRKPVCGSEGGGHCWICFTVWSD